MRTRVLSLLCFAVAIGCGGRELDDRTRGGAGGDALADAPVGEAGVVCDLSNGTPICGWPGCPQTCGGACVLLTDRDALPVKLSVCRIDAKDVFSMSANGKYAVQCAACPNDDDLCARILTQYQCVRPPLCGAFYSAGIRGCWFRDMTDWAPATIPAAPCIGPGFCGGACGGCDVGQSCTGRSPTHPVGVCAAVTGHQCWRHPENTAESCLTDGIAPGDDTCLAFRDSDPATQAAADEYGVCVPRARCLAARASLAGGVFCVDASGTEVP